MTAAASLPAALRAHAQGLHCLQAAAELLIGHATWLQRDDFLRHFVHSIPGLADGTPMAVIDWPEAITGLDQGQLPCSRSFSELKTVINIRWSPAVSRMRAGSR